MKNLRLLIVDDVEDNRLVLNAICRKIEGFDIQEAVDGIDAITTCDTWYPHIVLMDVMMPKLDGFEASKIIKSRHPEIIIIVVTAVINPQIEANFASIGVAAYLHKPIDKELIRYKLQNFAAFLRSKEGKHTKLSTKEALNPFNYDIRHFKTIFDINDAEGMMDFGVWVLSRCEESSGASSSKVDQMIELFYQLMRHEIRENEPIAIIIEESFEEIFFTMKLPKEIVLKPKEQELVNDLEPNCLIRQNLACVRLDKAGAASLKLKPYESKKPDILKEEQDEQTLSNESIHVIDEVVSDLSVEKETRSIDANEQGLLRQSFVNKTSAIEYIRDIGGDVLDEIRDLESLDNEWIEKLHILEAEPSVDNLRYFADIVLGTYVRAINNLFEFTALAYALSSLGTFMKEHADAIISDPKKLKMLVMLTEHLGSDLTSWRNHIFALQDAADIHYLDSSFFSSCMQIEQIVGNKEIETDDDMEFF